MTDAALPTPEPASAAKAAETIYDAFISYSHTKDKAIAGALQSVVQRLGKSWYQRRALRLFRDDSSLTATPHLWPSIETALGRSRYLIVLASPEAATSPWVDREVGWWLNHNGAETILIGLTAGALEWDEAAGDFRVGKELPLPQALKGRFGDEPLWIDLRAYRDDLRPRDAAFANLAAGIAAALHGTPKEDLLSQEVRQQRHTLRLAYSGLAALLVLLGLAAWQWQRAETQRALAEVQRARAENALKLATGSAGTLVFTLTEKFRHLGLPAGVAENILDVAYQLQEQLGAGIEQTPTLQFGEAHSLLGMATTLSVLGDHTRGLADAQEAYRILQELSSSAPDNQIYSGSLGRAQELIGNILLHYRDDPVEALKAYRQALAFYQKAAAKDPVTWGPSVDGTEVNIGATLLSQGDRAGALAILQPALTSAEKRASAEPGNADSQRDLAVAEENVGETLEAQSDQEGAVAAYRKSLAIRKALAASEAGNTQAQLDISVGDTHLAHALEAQDDLQGAYPFIIEARDIGLDLVTKDPTNGEWMRDLVTSDNDLGDWFMRRQDPTRALVAFQASQSMIVQLLQRDPANRLWQHDTFVTYGLLGWGFLAKGDLQAALAAYQQAEQIGLKIKDDDTNSSIGTTGLQLVRDQIADIQQRLGNGRRR